MSFEPREFLRHIQLEADYLVERSRGVTFEAFVAERLVPGRGAMTLDAEVDERFEAATDERAGMAVDGGDADRGPSHRFARHLHLTHSKFYSAGAGSWTSRSATTAIA